MHAKLGAVWLNDMGYDEIAKIVDEHMELKIIPDTPTEKEVVYLADKMVKGDKIVSIDERFSDKEKLYNHDENIIKTINKLISQLFIMLKSFIACSFLFLIVFIIFSS